MAERDAAGGVDVCLVSVAPRARHSRFRLVRGRADDDVMAHARQRAVAADHERVADAGQHVVRAADGVPAAEGIGTCPCSGHRVVRAEDLGGAHIVRFIPAADDERRAAAFVVLDYLTSFIDRAINVVGSIVRKVDGRAA